MGESKGRYCRVCVKAYLNFFFPILFYYLFFVTIKDCDGHV